LSPERPDQRIQEFIVGTGGESLDTLAVSNGVYANPNVITAYAQGYGVMNLTLRPDGYTFAYKPVLAGAGFGPSALDYGDSGSGHCRG
jgi:acid phosphatase type 7